MAQKVDLENLYSDAAEAIAKKEYDRAANLLKQILAQNENYRDASRLLAQIIQRKRRKWYNHPLLYASLACIVLVIVGVFVFPKVLGTIHANISKTLAIVTPTQITNPLEAVLLTPALTPTATPLPFHWVRIYNGQDFPKEEITTLTVDSKDPDVIYVGTRSAGIYKTINGGESWQPVNSGISIGSVDTMLLNVQNPKTLYALTQGELYKTTNGAEDWKRIADTNMVAMDPNNGEHLFIWTDRIIESFDGGETWTAESLKFQGVDNLKFLSVDWKDPDKLYAMCGNWFCSSSDGGVTWDFHKEKEFSDSNALAATVLPSGESGILVDAGDELGSDGLFFSSDGGNTWRFKDRICEIISVIPTDPSTIYCDYSRSKDGGQTWLGIIDRAFYENANVNTITFSGNEKSNLYVAGKEGVIYRSENGGVAFDQIGSNGLGSIPLALSISPANNNYFLLTQAQSSCSGVCYKNYFSTDGGITWNFLPITSWSEFYTWDADGTSIYGIKPSSNNLVIALMVSSDTGKNWKAVSAIPGPEQRVSIFWLGASPVQPGIIFVHQKVGSLPGLLRSTDGGLTWEQLNLDVGGNWSFRITGDRLWAQADNYLGYSDDLGVTFHECANGFIDLSTAITLLNQQQSNVVLWGNTRFGIAQSNNDCKNWSLLPSQPDTLAISTMASDPNDEYVVYVGSNSGAFISLDMGNSWAEINDGLLGADIIYSIVVDSEGKVIASTPYGIFKLEGR